MNVGDRPGLLVNHGRAENGRSVTVQKFCRENHQPSASAVANRRSPMTHVVIMGAAGRDFHNFNVVFRDDPQYRVVAFTAAQIPNIAGRMYPPELAGTLYPTGIPIVPEEELESVIASNSVGQVIEDSSGRLCRLLTRLIAERGLKKA